MADKEMLDLVAYYAWPIVWMDSGCVIVTKGGSTSPTPDVRQAIRDAMRLQAAWALAA